MGSKELVTIQKLIASLEEERDYWKDCAGNFDKRVIELEKQLHHELKETQYAHSRGVMDGMRRGGCSM